jgi:hypothetical protein
MIDPALAAATVSAIAATVSLADSVYTSWRNYAERRRARKGPQPSFRERLVASPDASELSYLVKGKVPQTVTRAELQRLLTKADADDIEAAEREMRELVGEWLRITNSEARLTPQERTRLNEIALGLAAHMSKITDRLIALGFRLDDHYDGMRRIAEWFAGPQANSTRSHLLP